MCLDLLYVFRCTTCAEMCCMCLDALYVLGCVVCAWVCFKCLDVLQMLGCATCAVCAWMHFYSQATYRSPSRMHQFKATSILVT